MSKVDGAGSSATVAQDIGLQRRARAYILSCIYNRRITMATARVFRSGNSQAVRLPKQFRLSSREVEIFRRGDELVLREKARGIARAFELLANLPDDFMAAGRQDRPPQSRKGL